jgi:hypothetical protein
MISLDLTEQEYEVLQSLLSKMAVTPQEWLSTEKAATILGKSSETLKRKVRASARAQQSDFVQGIHYRITSDANAEVPRYEFNVVAIGKLWNEPPERRNRKRKFKPTLSQVI